MDEGGWQDIADAMQVDLRMLARARQVHGSGVSIAEIAPEPSPSADIIVTGDARRAVAVSAADCAPILMVDGRTGAVAAAHAGWRGLAIGVPAATVEGLVRGYGSRPADLLVAVGPSIGACCYEVGREVREAFGSGRFARESIERLFHEHPSSSGCNPSVPRLVETRRPQHWFFDGWAAVREQLAEGGVPAEQVFVAELCTASHPELFCSFRRDGPPAGRLAAVIKPRSPRP